MSKRRKRFLVKYKKKDETTEVWKELTSPRKVKKFIRRDLEVDFRFPYLASLKYDFVKIVDTKKCTNLKEKSVNVG